MPHYIYKALQENGQQVKGETWADSIDILKLQLESKGLLLQSIKAKSTLFSRRIQQHITLEQFHLFNHEFIVLLKAGVSVTESLKEVSRRPGQSGFSSALSDVLQHVMSGESLVTACQRFPNYFEPLYISALETGESVGDLVSTLSRFQKQLGNRIKLQRLFKDALAYPLFLILLLSFVMVILFTFVLPRFVSLYADFGSELPIATQWLMTAVETLPTWGTLFVVIILLSILGYQSYKQTEEHRHQIGKILLATPVIGQLFYLRASAQMSRILASLLESGVPMIDAIKKTASVLSNRAYAKKLSLTAEQVVAGASLSSSLKEQQLISGSAYKIIKAGEKAGNIAQMFDEIADYYEELLSSKLNRFTRILEPLLMLIVGIVVGSIILVMYLPIFSMADVIR